MPDTRTDGSAVAFGALLRRFRMAAGLSQESLAERARISTEAVGSLERGTRKAPQRQTLELLIAALDLSAADRALLMSSVVRPATPRRREAGAATTVASALVLPPSLTSFIGRESELDTLVSMLEGTRLLSVLGPGGVGKSRLALELARRSANRFPDGIALVALQQLAPGGSVVQAIASTLGVADEGSVQLLARIAAAVGATRRLLILDNCEHLVEDVAPVVFILLSGCANLTVLATSREALRVTGEQIFRLGPLAPDAAAELFVARARSVAPHKEFTADELATVDLICRRVDGIPLAIELAASRTDMLDPSMILDRLRTRFQLLTGGSRTVLPHHRTLRALVDWSHELLEPDEVRVFRRLGGFAGGCRLDDAERILSFDGIAADDVVDVLGRLHDKSLVDVTHRNAPRFEMLQTIREYAVERLTEAGETAQLERVYATHYLEVAFETGPSLRGATQRDAIGRIAADADNIRRALELSRGDEALREAGLRALGPLALYWIRTGALTEGASWIESLVTDDLEPSTGLAWACVGGAWIEYNRRRNVEGRAYAVRACAAAAAGGDEWLATYALLAECFARSIMGEDVTATTAAAHARAERLGDSWLLASAAYEQGLAAQVRQDFAGAAHHLSEALDHARATGDVFIVSTALHHLGRALTPSEPGRAARLIGDAIDHLAPGVVLGRAACIEALVLIALSLHRSDDATQLLRLACNHRAAAGGALNAELIEAVRARIGADLIPDGASASLDDAGETIRAFIAAVT